MAQKIKNGQTSYKIELVFRKTIWSKWNIWSLLYNPIVKLPKIIKKTIDDWLVSSKLICKLGN